MLAETLSILALAACARGTVAARPTPAPGPRLFVHITVDQMAANYFDRFGGAFRGGFARLLREGAVFSEAFQDHGITETAPGHSVVLSGRYPYSTGIVRNSEGVSDTGSALLETGGPGASPRRFTGTALIDWLRSRWPGAQMFSVSRKDRGAILPAGRTKDADVYWIQAGTFTTSLWYRGSLPAWVRAFDAGMPHDSTPYYDRPDLDSLSIAFALQGQLADSLGMRLGRGPDVLAISLSALDAVGHQYGPESPQVASLVRQLDGWLGLLFDSLDARVGRGRWVVSLTGDHGITPRPEVSRSHGVAAEYVDVDTVIAMERAALAQRLGPGRWIPFRDVGMVSLDRAGLQARGLNVDSVAEDLAAKLRALPGVAEVDTRASLARADTTRDIAALRWRRMLAPGVRGEVFITLTVPNYLGRATRSTEHGQATDPDAHVVLVLAGPGVRPGRYGRRVGVVDLAPTLAVLAGVRPDAPVDGRPLREALR